VLGECRPRRYDDSRHQRARDRRRHWSPLSEQERGSLVSRRRATTDSRVRPRGSRPSSRSLATRARSARPPVSPRSCTSTARATSGRSVNGSTSRSSAFVIPGWVSSMPGRPAPGWRMRSVVTPCASSCRPFRIAWRASPVADEPIASPPKPIAIDSAAAHNRRVRSLSSGPITTYLATSVAFEIDIAPHRTRVRSRVLCLWQAN
jgi:hypothetical protein